MHYDLVEVTVNVVPEEEGEDHGHNLQDEGNQGASGEPDVQVEMPFEDKDETEDGEEDAKGAGNHHHDGTGQEV